MQTSELLNILKIREFLKQCVQIIRCLFPQVLPMKGHQKAAAYYDCIDSANT